MLGFGYFDTADRETGERLTNTPAAVEDLKRRLLSRLEASKISLISNDQRWHYIKSCVGPDQKVSLTVTSKAGSEYTYRWPIDKLMGQIEAGFLAEYGGDLHSRWIENSKPRPLSETERVVIEEFSISADSLLKAFAERIGKRLASDHLDEQVDYLTGPK